MDNRMYSDYTYQSDTEGDESSTDITLDEIGTTQIYVQRLISHHMEGLYFLRLEPDFMGDKGLDIESFASEIRNEADIRCFLRAQEGILDYFCKYLELLPEGMESQSKRLDEIMLGIIHNLEIEDENFLSLIVEDPFFNRMTNINELI